MAKTIKFNLICDNSPVRTIEDLQNNFSVEDVLEYYNNRLLHRWLEVRGYQKELEAVSAIKECNPIKIIESIIRIFDIEVDQKKIKERIWILQYLEERKELCQVYAEQNNNVKDIIDDYRTGYWQLVEEIYNNPNDVSKIKAVINELVENYRWIVELDHRALFWRLFSDEENKYLLAIMCLLMNNTFREYYLPEDKIFNEDGTITLRKTLGDGVDDTEKIYDAICSLVNQKNFEELLPEHVISFSGETDGYWKDLESKGKKYMILKMGLGDYVRAAGQNGGDLTSPDINNKFVIVNGIDYKSNSATRKLLYMEV